MDPAVHDELVQRDPGHLAADGVEAADDHGFRGVVDDEVDPGRLLQGTDVAPFLADDAAFELVGRPRHHGSRDSAVWSAAMRWIDSVTISLARRSLSSRAASSASR